MKYKAPLEERKFKKLVESYGFKVVSSSKHHKIVYSFDNKTVMVFAVHHSKQGKREVKPIYINLFLNKIQELGI